MLKLFRAMMMCFSMFCEIPCPYHKWDEDARPLMTLFLPVVGLFIGCLWALLAWLIEFFKLPEMLGAALLCVYPFLVTGFMHLDGYLYSLGGKPTSLADVAERADIITEMKAYKEGNVWCTTPDFFQISDTIGSMINDIRLMMEADADTDTLTYLVRLK